MRHPSLLVLAAGCFAIAAALSLVLFEDDIRAWAERAVGYEEMIEMELNLGKLEKKQ